jgi:hypothetical protein
MFGYRQDDPAADLSIDLRDSSPGAPKSVVVDDAFDWGGDRPPDTPWRSTVIYETHVRGLTKLTPISRPTSAAPTPGSRTRRVITPHLARHHRRASSFPSTNPPTTASWPTATSATTGVQHARVLRARAALHGRPHARRAGRRIQVDGQGAARGRDRSHPRSSFTTTPPRATTSGRRSACAGSTTRPTTG